MKRTTPKPTCVVIIMPRGRPSFEITPEIIERVEELAGQGLPKYQIAHLIGISYETFNEKAKEFSDFSDAIERGKAQGIETMTNALFHKAQTGDTAAIKYYLNNRSDDWSETQKHVHSGPNDGPIETINREMTAEEAAKIYSQEVLGNG